jgi:hypothetical protein
MDPNVGRFFAPKGALLALGIWVIAGGIGAYTAYRVVVDHVISIGGAALAGAVFLGGIGALTTAFPQGCRSCKRAFESTGAAFAQHLYPNLAAALAQPVAATLTQWAAAPPADGSGTLARLTVDFCPVCRRLATARMTAEHWQGQYYHVDQQSPSFVLKNDAAAAVLQMIDARARLMPPPQS